MVKFIRKLPGVGFILDRILKNEVKGALKLLAGKDGGSSKFPVIPIPEEGLSPEKILQIMDKLHSNEDSAEKGKSFAYTYTTASEMAAFSTCLGEAYSKFTENSGSAIVSHEVLLTEVKSC